MYADGYSYITNIDFSAVVIEDMRLRDSDACPEMDCKFPFCIIMLDVELDISLPLEILDPESFTCILDKGCFDCIACSAECAYKTKQALENIYKVLAPGGFYLNVSFGRPETRMNYFRELNWSVETIKVPKKST